MVVMYITPNVGIGNQMFMYGTALAVARREHQKVFLLVGLGRRADRPFWLPSFSLTPPPSPFNCLVLKDLKDSPAKTRLVQWVPRFMERRLSGYLRVEKWEESRTYHEIPRGQKAYFLRGYFECLRYIDPVLPELREQYRPRVPVSERTKALWDRIHSDPNAVALHIRMGDFVKLHRNLPLSYYDNAMAYHKSVNPEARFYLLTEDASVRAHFLGMDEVTLIDLSGEEHRDIVEWNCLTQCRHHILSTSTYSWWAAVLSETEESVIAIPSLELYHRHDSHKGDSTERYQNFYRPGWHPVSADDADMQ